MGQTIEAGTQPRKSDRARLRMIGSCLAIALAAAFVTLSLFSPRFFYWRLAAPDAWRSPELNRAISTMQQIDQPWSPVTNASNRVISWRLLLPLTWHYLDLPRSLFLILPQVGCVLTLWLTAWLTQQRLRHFGRTAITVTLFAALPWFFVSSGWWTYFDSWLVLALLSVSFISSRRFLALACLLAPWVDERFLFALPVCLAVRIATMGWLENKLWRPMVRDLAVIAGASLPYLALRAGFSFLGEDRGSTDYMAIVWRDMRTVPWTRYGEGLWSGFRAAWLPVIAAPGLWWRRGGRRRGMLLGGLVAVSAVGGLFIASDMSRTMTILCPVLLLGIWQWHAVHAASLRLALPLILAANLLLPAEHVVSTFKIPLASFRTETAYCRNPPPGIYAGALVEQGIQRLKENNPAAARQEFAAAIGVDSTFVPAYLWRATVNLPPGDSSAVAADLATALRLAPGLPDALLLRARLHQADRQTGAAVTDLQQAMANAPPGWPQREQAAVLLRQLTVAAPPGTP